MSRCEGSIRHLVHNLAWFRPAFRLVFGIAVLPCRPRYVVDSSHPHAMCNWVAAAGKSACAVHVDGLPLVPAHLCVGGPHACLVCLQHPAPFLCTCLSSVAVELSEWVTPLKSLLSHTLACRQGYPRHLAAVLGFAVLLFGPVVG
jgi:hypothetical protein